MAEEIFEEMFDDTTLDKVQEGDMKNLSSLVKDLDQINYIMRGSILVKEIALFSPSTQQNFGKKGILDLQVTVQKQGQR